MKTLLYASFILSAVISLAPQSLFSSDTSVRAGDVQAQPAVQYRQTRSRTSRSPRRYARHTDGNRQLAKQTDEANGRNLDPTVAPRSDVETSEVAVVSAP